MKARYYIIGLLAIMILVGTVSAFDFDNIKSYDTKFKEVTIDNAFGLGDELAKIRLISEQDTKVIRGKDRKVAELEVWNFDKSYDLSNSMGIIDLYNYWTSRQINRNYVYKIRVVTSNINKSIFINVCKNSTKDEVICHYEYSHSEIVPVYEWKEIKTVDDLPDVYPYRVGIFTDVYPDEKVEWVPTFYGQKVQEWASWSESLDQDLYFYFKLDETSGAVVDSIGTQNMTNEGATTGVTGIINDAYNLTLADSDRISMIKPYEFSNNNQLAISLWINPTSWTGAGLNRVWSGGGATQDFIRQSSGSFEAGLRAGGSYYIASWSGNSPALDTWSHIVINYNVSTVTLWVNADDKASAIVPTGRDNSSILGFGMRYGNEDRFYDGIIDEIGIWNRSLSDAEIIQLYNGGSGISYTPSITGNATITVTLLSPADSTLTDTATNDFIANITVTRDLNNSNATLYIWNSTDDLNYTEVNTLTGNSSNVTTFNSVFLKDGDYNWNVEGCGNNGTTTLCDVYSSNYSISIDTTSPILTLWENISNALYDIADYSINVSLNYTVEDLHVTSCFYWTSDEGTNHTFECNGTVPVNVSFDYYGNKTIYYGANDSYNQVTTDSINFQLGVFDYYTTDEDVAEGGTFPYTLDINYSNIGTETITAYLLWNNTVYAPSSATAIDSDTYQIIRSLTIPDGIGNQSGKTIFWNWSFNASESGNYTTRNNNITVRTLDFDDCSAYPYLLYNFTLRHEDTRALINESYTRNIEVDLQLTSIVDSNIFFTYNASTSGNGLAICVPDGVINTTSYRTDIVAEYSATNHATEFWYEDNGRISNTTAPSIINLYDLPLADSTTFLFSFEDENGLTVPSSIVHVLRYYIGLGTFLEVERAKEDNNGETHLHLVEEDVIYIFKVSEDNTYIFTSDQYNAKCLSEPCSITLTAQETTPQFPTSFDNLPEGTYNLKTDRSLRQVVLGFNLNESATMNLTIYQENYETDESDIVVASGKTTASTGSVIVTVPMIYGNNSYYAVIYKDDKFVNSQMVDLSENKADYFGTLGLLLAGIMVLVFVLIGVTQGELIVVWTILGVVIVGAMFIFVPYYAVISLVCAGGLLLWKLMQGRNY